MENRQPIRQPITIPAIESRIASYIAGFLGVDAAEVDMEMDVERFGLNSAVVVSLVGDLEDWLGVELSPSILYEFPTVRSVSRHLHAQLGNT